jgi:hypothetical protein
VEECGVIRVKLDDGTERVLSEAEVKLTWRDDDGTVHEYDLAAVEKLMLIQPDLFLAPGLMNDMPVVGLALRDESGLGIETPMPVGFALDLAERIPVDVIEAQQMSPRAKLTLARTMPRLPKPPGNGAA